MKFNKQIAIILVLVSLLISALGSAYYFYIENKKSIQNSNTLVMIYVAAKDIQKNTKISTKDIKTFQIAKRFILNKPLLKKDIVGKYAKVDFYKNDTFTNEKLSTKLNIVKQKSSLEDFKSNSYNIAFSLFKNPNFALKQDDIVNIISVYPTTTKKINNSPNEVHYVAKHIKVLGFILDNIQSDDISKKIKITKKVKNKNITTEITKIAGEVILDIDDKTILSLIDDYNRGKQLWMVKTKLKDEIKPKVKKKVTKYKRKYPIILYKPKDKFDTLFATIHYADQKNAALRKNKTVKMSSDEICKNSDKFLLGTSNRVYLRTGMGREYKIARIVYKNYIIPYTKKMDNGWYLSCDNYYVNKNEAKEVSKKFVDTKLKR